MFGCNGLNGKGLRTAGAVLMVGILASCSYVPDALNPIEWYKGAEDLVTGRERPQVASPRPVQDTAKTEPATTQAAAEAPKKEPAKGLVADHDNAKYAQPVRREVNPTKPLARRAAPPAEVQTATTPVPQAVPAPAAMPPAPVQAPAAPGPDARAPMPAPVQVTQAAPRGTAERPHLDPIRPQPTARDVGPAAPPASVDMQPPARPDIPETVPVPGQKLKPVQAHYQKRLAESASTVVRPDVVDNAGAAAGSEEPIHLIPPTARKAAGRGGKGFAAPSPAAGPAATFQVAALDFQSDSATLTRADRANIAEVARLYRRTGGVVRVVGIAPGPAASGRDAVADVMGGFDASMKRATAVAKELTRRGVPAHKIMIGADPTPAVADGVGARVFLDVI